ncbi:DUF3857 domain-containing protein [Chryseobacterium camelliae]|uniref:DUF3857 domain-containing protein n=1 Tax=Chryseobacterium camelliae TaxID=1265445 RepID=UPI0028548175|nr:DUF3857 domain-containing protein [Chryseobacterium camelliae]MDR6514031.1 hypothetical protein [Chryseobacterium camelliae]
MMKIFCIGALSIASLHFAQNFPASAIPEPLKKNANLVIRKDLTILQINSVDEIRYQYQKVRTVMNKDGKDQATPVIAYQKGDQISDVKVTIYDEAGKKIKSYSKSNFGDFANTPDGIFYSDDRFMSLPYTPTQYPYTIEFSYQLKDQNTVFIPDFVPFSTTNTSVESKELRVINNSGIELKTKTYPSKYNYAAVAESGSSTDKVYSFKDVPAVDGTFLMPQPDKILPKVSFALTRFNLMGKQGSISSWKDFGTWYYNSILQPVSTITPAVKAEVAALHLQGTTEEKVKKLYQYMQSKTRYIAVALGIGGWQPMQPEEVSKKGYGDCKGLTNYMKVLLDEAGIPSNYCVINSGDSQLTFDPEFPKMGGNHVILMVPTEKGSIWLENTSQMMAFNHLSTSTTDRNVLSIGKNGIELISTPVYSPEQNNEKQVLKIRINEDNSITGEGQFSYTGNQYDYNVAFTGLSPKERNEAIRDRLSVLSFDKIEMKNVINDRDNAVARYELDFKAGNYSKTAGNSMLFRAVPIFTNVIYKNDEARELPFELQQSFQDDYEITFTVPAQYKLDEIPENVSFNSEFGSYQLNFVRNGTELKVNRSIRINKGIYPKEKYNEYINFRKKTLKNDNSKILISKA